MTSVDSKGQLENCYSPNKTVVCIPAYNEARNISEIVRQARKYAMEVIVYDDGSHDGTSEIAEAAGAVIIRDPINRGYGAAINALFQTAKARNADAMVTLDADGQHNPAQIPEVLEPIINGESDIVIGSRFLQSIDSQKVPRYRSFGIRAITKVTCVASFANLTDSQSGFRAYGKRALAKIDLFEEGMEVSTEILLKAKEKSLRVSEVPVAVKYDLKETSTHNPLLHGIKL